MGDKPTVQSLTVKDLTVGCVFKSTGVAWIVVDMGQHHAITIYISNDIKANPDIFDSPPYPITVDVFDNEDFSNYTKEDIVYRPNGELTVRQAFEQYLREASSA